MAKASRGSRVYSIAIAAILYALLAATTLLAASRLGGCGAAPLPTTQPTPTALPLVQPTLQPTSLPLAQPTVQPASLPVAQPAVQPTQAPLAPVCCTREPTAVPVVLVSATPTPTTQPVAVGALIELRVRCSAQGCRGGPRISTVVQWQDGAGAWHDVLGWQGPLDEGWRRVWWVAEKDLGTGPFRWLILPACGCGEIAVSEPFYLPPKPGETAYVEVTLGP